MREKIIEKKLSYKLGGSIVNFQDKYLKPKRVLNGKTFVDSDKFVVSDRDRGFSLIELAVVIGIVVVLALVSFIGLVSRRDRTNLSNAAQQIATLLREAQSRAVAQETGTTWGVHFDDGAAPPFYAIFKTSYSVTNAQGSYVLPSLVCFATSSVPQGGTLDITFAQISGLPSTSTPITLNLINGICPSGLVVATSAIQINSNGLIAF